MFSFVATDKGEKQFYISLTQNMRSRMVKYQRTLLRYYWYLLQQEGQEVNERRLGTMYQRQP